MPLWNLLRRTRRGDTGVGKPGKNCWQEKMHQGGGGGGGGAAFIAENVLDCNRRIYLRACLLLSVFVRLPATDIGLSNEAFGLGVCFRHKHVHVWCG